ncbi:sporulation protein YunB [Halobacillus amylolyticus]|uniref:Sporulation protein YunB n=1 Tax=Halobacillus amylolyticus TaxID=2932259 RepID=A0ABY4HAI0_9BACI|nr:sporulation protein YunB [Halobacillus amylolyticus]UOR11812.1 sporulation protein YunB [Halobacillus amylolyticus]
MGTKKTNPPSIGKRILITFICFAIITGSCLWLIDRGITPVLQGIAETKAQQLARDAINEAVSRQIAEDLQFENLVRIEKDNEGNITYMGWNSAVVNKALRNTTLRVQNFLRRMEQNELPLEDTTLDSDINRNGKEKDKGEEPATLIEVPIGLATNNTILANLGPKVPVQLQVIGDVQSQFVNEIKEYGINSAFFELSLNFKVSLRVVIPFSGETIIVDNDIPIDTSTIVGEVPEFYNGDGEEESPTFSLPMTGLQ